MPEPTEIAAHVARLLERDRSLAGKHVVVTAGATREAIDPVRFISNHSSGKMGLAIASAAWRRGAVVTLITGHVDVTLPAELDVVRIGTTEELQEAVRAALPTADVLIMAAAPADFRAADVAAKKIKKGEGARAIALTATPDVLKSTITDRKEKVVVVGFALETHNVVEYAQQKLREKRLDLVVANQAGMDGAGFGVDTNLVTIVGADGTVDALPLMSKDDVAEALLDRVGGLLDGR
jgi:phosphopantothenoylcysteine decarboxylase/phosphopantothenate--cysteine ligase